jgi:hypothetical protein
MTASNRFEDRLLEQLLHVVAERPAPDVIAHRAPRRTRLALAGVSVTAATAVVAIVATSSDVTPRAYAVEPRPDGSVTVKIHSLRDAAGLQRNLRAAGVPAVVDYVPAGEAGCVGPGPGPAAGASQGPSLRSGGEGRSDTGRSLSGPGPRPGDGATMSKVAVGRDGVTFTIDPGNIKPGEKVYITTSTGTVSSIGMAITKDRPDAPCATTDATP